MGRSLRSAFFSSTSGTQDTLLVTASFLPPSDCVGLVDVSPEALDVVAVAVVVATDVEVVDEEVAAAMGFVEVEVLEESSTDSVSEG